MYAIIDTGSGQGSSLAHRGELSSAISAAVKLAPINGRAVEVWNPDTQTIVAQIGTDGEVSWYPRGA